MFNSGSEAAAFLFSLLGIVVTGYIFAWRGKNAIARRIGSVMVALPSALVAFVGTAGYLLPALRDIRAFSKADAFAAVILATICAGAWFTAFRYVRFAFRKEHVK